MGVIDDCNNCNDKCDDLFLMDEVSLIKCTYEIKDNDYIQIINNRDTKNVNKEIETKIKILNNGKKEQIIFKKKFPNKGIYTIDFLIEEKLNDMSNMFKECSSLKEINFVSVDTTKVIKMIGTFEGCKELEYLDLSNFNTSNVTDM